LAPEFPFKF